jgi:hypothetical protein
MEAVGTNQRAERSGARIPLGTREFLFSETSTSALGPSQPWGSFLGVKWSKHEVDNSLPSSAEVKNEWSFTSIHPVYLHGFDREKFTVIV